MFQEVIGKLSSNSGGPDALLDKALAEHLPKSILESFSPDNANSEASPASMSERAVEFKEVCWLTQDGTRFV